MATMFTPPNEPEAARSNRRKVCDLCFTKKIKCDMLKPVCSNCILYKADCKTSIIRRKANPPKAKAAPLSQTVQGQLGGETLEARLARIEKQLQEVLASAKEVHRPDTAPQSNAGSSSDGFEHADVMMDPAMRAAISEDAGQLNPWRFDPIQPQLYHGAEPDAFVLPPLDEVLPIVDHYFACFNSVIPLFHQDAFMHMLNSWYNDPMPRDRGTWAAVQIVMALAFRTPRLTAVDSPVVQIEKADQCLRCAQSVISELVTRESDLLGVQILLGVVMLFQNSRDPKPASVIVGTAVRLAHRLGLHAADASRYFNHDEVEQRSRVFWIAYTLDKDISLRAYTPSTLFDDDIDIPLPALAPADSAGLIWTQNGQVHFNYHRRRVELAHIEGKVYDLLYSNRATKVKGAERQQRVARLQAMLDAWYERIPSVFHIENAASNVGPSQLVQLTKMHHAYLLAEVMIHGIYSHNADWVQRISSFSRSAMHSTEKIPQTHGNQTCYSNRQQSAPLPDGWSKCVEVSRGCMKLFQGATPTECLIWYDPRFSFEEDPRLTPNRQCSCAHFSGLIIILANMSINPSHELVAQDQHIALKALTLFDQLLDIVEDDAFRALRIVIGELSEKANAAVENQRLESSEGVFGSLDALVPMGTEALDFLPEMELYGEAGGVFAAVDEQEVLRGSVFGLLDGGEGLPGMTTIADLDDFLR
ncbi:fungal-specific transcription factor domain-containing protein [Dactylonectria macrodidyma]|uniref:Fungal-specific transcription factor domain-containing protein n=1 Tax=Dactylonectria macrodidyma TaxID=307937 RepID=A0A9P9DLG4_9HYPO|nr:fungal-specific transcription factor domain-containing protein [Dactylonectria macrodidyma]